jgi:hypothetical protein
VGTEIKVLSEIDGNLCTPLITLERPDAYPIVLIGTIHFAAPEYYQIVWKHLKSLSDMGYTNFFEGTAKATPSEEEKESWHIDEMKELTAAFTFMAQELKVVFQSENILPERSLPRAVCAEISPNDADELVKRDGYISELRGSAEELACTILESLLELKSMTNPLVGERNVFVAKMTQQYAVLNSPVVVSYGAAHISGIVEILSTAGWKVRTEERIPALRVGAIRQFLKKYKK